MLLDDGQVMSYVLDLVLDGAVELFEHKKEDESGVRTKVTFLQHGIDLEHFREFMQGIDGVVAGRDDKALADDEVDLLLVRLV